MTYLIWMSVFCAVTALGLGFALYKTKHDAKEISFGVGFLTVIGIIVTFAAYYTSMGVATADVEIWNGKITSKDRVHGEYTRSYSCNCVQTCTGTGPNQSCTQTCQTCYEDHYTVNWTANSTIGNFPIHSLDWTSRSVYAQPNPQRWSIINPGDPAAARHLYTNYVQAVPESLFHRSSESLKAQFASLIPPYPDNVFDLYRINRFLTPGYSTPDAPDWNADISNMLRDLGPSKQVNAIVVIAKTNDPNYEFALRDAWEGANKNDVVLLIGSSQWPKIDFVRVISWTKNERFKLELRNEVEAIGTIQRAPIMATLERQISKNFERRRMREFKDLENEISPPTWLAILNIVIILGIAAFMMKDYITPYFKTKSKIKFNPVGRRRF